MDRIDRNRSRIIIATLQERIRKLQEQFTKRFSLAFPVATLPKESTVRKLKFGILLILGLVFGTVAHRLNVQEFELQWKKIHLPSPEIWKSSFAAEKFRGIENPSILGRLTRSLPSLADRGGRIWSSVPDWWAIESPGTNQPQVFCLSCDLRKPPLDWKEMGSGWDAWDDTMKTAHEEARLYALRAFRPGKRGETADPRAIRY
jgi:hypothetical protein